MSNHNDYQYAVLTFILDNLRIPTDNDILHFKNGSEIVLLSSETKTDYIVEQLKQQNHIISQSINGKTEYHLTESGRTLLINS